MECRHILRPFFLASAKGLVLRLGTDMCLCVCVCVWGGGGGGGGGGGIPAVVWLWLCELLGWENSSIELGTSELKSEF